MTRKRFMKLAMGEGVSRNTARDIAKTLREMRETETRIEHFVKTGEEEKAQKEIREYKILKIKANLHAWIAQTEAKRYARVNNISYIKKENSLTGV